MSNLQQAHGALVAASREVEQAMARAQALKIMLENTITGAGEASRKLEQAKTLAYNAIGARAGNISGLMVQLDDKASVFVQQAQGQIAAINEYLSMAANLRRHIDNVASQIRGLMG